jgi:hypothetical protein
VKDRRRTRMVLITRQALFLEREAEALLKAQPASG